MKKDDLVFERKELKDKLEALGPLTTSTTEKELRERNVLRQKIDVINTKLSGKGGNDKVLDTYTPIGVSTTRFKK